jgi:hypothetical protein
LYEDLKDGLTKEKDPTKWKLLNLMLQYPQLTKLSEIQPSPIVEKNLLLPKILKHPFAFTEQGVAMLSGLLNSDIAIDTN